MNCFRLPKSLIHELHQIIARFWWNGSESDRRLHWVSWTDLCRPKCMGGLGFRNLEFFNQALLGKQCWKILHEPSSLLARSLRGRYFPTGNFLSARLGHRPSFLWRSLLWGRELLDQGIRWRIGDGRAVPIYKTNWIPRDYGLQVQSVPSLPEFSCVNQLRSPSGQWNRALISLHFDEEEREYILGIPCGGVGQQDQWVWHYEKTGRYSVKSGYRLAIWKEMQRFPSSSSMENTFLWWNRFWKLGVPPKVKIFMWRACLNRLPCKMNLISRGIDVSNFCPLCQRSGEDILHTFWSCKFARKVWCDSRFSSLYRPWLSGPFLELVTFIQSSVSWSDFEEIVVLWWALWNRRNGELFRGVSPVSDVGRWAAEYIRIFRETRTLASLSRKTAPIRSSPRWVPPVGSVYKVNTDASFLKSSARAGLGIIIRDWRGRVMFSGSRFLPCCGSSDLAEGFAAREGVRVAQDLGLLPLQLEVDSQRVYQIVAGEVDDISELGFLLQEVRAFVSRDSLSSVSFTFREGNRVAHLLAGHAVSCSADDDWVEAWPDFIDSFVSAECIEESSSFS